MSQQPEKSGKPIWAIIGVVALVLAIGGAALATFLSSRNENPPVEQKYESEDKDGDKDDDKDDDKD